MQANTKLLFCCHLGIVPLVLVGWTVMVFFGEEGTLSRGETLLAPLPALAYGIVYSVNVLVNGVGEPPAANDFYGFVYWGLPVGFGIFAGILLMSWTAGALLRRGNRAGSRTQTE